MTKTAGLEQISFFHLANHRLQLTRQPGDLLSLSAFSGDFPISLSVLAGALRAGEQLLCLLGNHGLACPVPLAQLAQVKSILTEASEQGIKVEIASSVERLRQVPWEYAPLISYQHRPAGSGQLHRPEDIHYHGNGWFSSRAAYWQLPDVGAADDSWLEKRTIPAEMVVEFLRDILPDWQRRRWRFQCDLSYDQRPLQQFIVRSVDQQRMLLDIDWNEEAGDQIVDRVFPGHVLQGSVLRPGLAKDRLVGDLSEDNQRLTLGGVEIPRFLAQLADEGERLLLNFQAGLRQHRLLRGHGRLLLLPHREEIRGIGTVHGVPTFQVDDFSVSASKVSAKLLDSHDYLHLSTAWATLEQVAEANIALFGRAADGSALDPISLTPSELLTNCSERLDGPWQQIGYPRLEPPEADSPEQTVVAHLKFLTHWGLPGGILGSVHRHGGQLIAFLEEFAQQHRGRILIVGTKTVLNYLSRIAHPGAIMRWDQQTPEVAAGWNRFGIVTVTPKWLESAPCLEQIDWDLLCLINADSLIKSRNSTLFRRLSNLHKLLFIGLFSDLSFRQRRAAQVAIADLMEVEDLPLHCWRFLLRNPEQPPERLAGVQKIVPRTRDGLLSQVSESRPYVLVRYAQRLVEEASYVADRLRNKRVLAVPFVEYYSVRPSMSDMNKQQFSWYIYWRHQVGQGQYLDSGLDYITLLAAELLNQIGVDSPLQGYQRLHQLWLHYRRPFPSLDNSILHWMVDYLLEYQLPIDPLQPYREAAEMGVAVPAVDLLLHRFVGRPFSEVPYCLVASLSSYRAERSKFILDGHQELFQQAVCAALDGVNEHWRSTLGQGIWEYFRPRRYRLIRRRLFQNAPFHGRSRLINFGSALPYSEQAALRSLVTGVIKHTENFLRQLHGYRGKLRAYHLPTALMSLIEERLQDFRGHKMAREPIEIDLGRVQQLTEQSDQMRDLLLSLSQSEQAEQGSEKQLPELTASANPPISPPAEAPPATTANLQPDDGWRQLFAGLSALDRQALSILAHSEQEDAWRQFCLDIGEMPEVLLDRVNALSLETISDLLVEDETGRPQIMPEYLTEVLRQLAREVDHG
ncbi:MAG: TerB N-terminal domain-containing protein [Bacillota bacterium]|jgi:hypothetical protein